MNLLEEIDKLRGHGRWMWTNAQLMAVEMEVDRNAAAAWLPGGLKMDDPARATFFVADYPETTFDCVYREAAVLLHVRFGPLKARHCPWMVVDDDVALILGRELLGYPKKMADMAVTRDGDRIEATADRQGARLIDIRGTVGEVMASPPPLIAHRTINVWGTLGLSVQTLLTFTPKEQIIEARTADVTVKVGGGKNDPLDELRPGRVTSAILYRINVRGGKMPPVPILPVSPHFAFRNWKLRYA
jgi:acetoacetate decarboxylase